MAKSLAASLPRERPGILSFFIVVMVVNAVMTAVHYILIFKGVIPHTGMDMSEVQEFAVADTIAVVIPSIIGAYGLWKLRSWGLLSAVFLSGGYTHGLIGLLMGAVTTSQFSAMSFVSVYFLAFSFALVAYLWQKRALFS